MNNERMNIFIAKVTLSKEVSGEETTILHKFSSEEEVVAYFRNNRPYILNFEIVKRYTDLSFEEFNDLWHNILKTPHDMEKSQVAIA